MTAVEQGIGIRRLQHIVLNVSDLDRSVAFYENVLGFRLRRRTPLGAFLHLAGSGNDHDLALFPAPNLRPPDEGTARLFHAAWQVDSLEDFARAQKWLTEKGALTDTARHGVSLSLYGTDPDGLPFEVCWAPPQFDDPFLTVPLDMDAELRRWGVAAPGSSG